jgi:hypothetical protein
LLEALFLGHQDDKAKFRHFVLTLSTLVNTTRPCNFVWLRAFSPVVHAVVAIYVISQPLVALMDATVLNLSSSSNASLLGASSTRRYSKRLMPTLSTSDCKRALGWNLQNLNTANRSTGFFFIDASDQCLNQLVGGV